MLPGQKMPRYRCKYCGYEWARGGRCGCRKCGKTDGAELVALGQDGYTRSFRRCHWFLDTKEKKR